MVNFRKPLQKLKSLLGQGANGLRPGLRVIRQGKAMRVVFFYPGEEGTYVENTQVTLYENGIVHIVSKNEETTTHLQSCEILWSYEDNEDRADKIRLLKPKFVGTPRKPGLEDHPDS